MLIILFIISFIGALLVYKKWPYREQVLILFDGILKMYRKDAGVTKTQFKQSEDFALSLFFPPRIRKKKVFLNKISC